MPRGIKLKIKNPAVVAGNKVAVVKATSLPVASHTPTPTKPLPTPSVTSNIRSIFVTGSLGSVGEYPQFPQFSGFYGFTTPTPV